MRYIICIFFLSFINSKFVVAQVQSFGLREKIQSADSIIITSHKGLLYQKEGGKIGRHNLLINGEINPQIIEEKLTIDKQLGDSAYILLSATNPSNIFEMTKCFDPHHAIFIFKNGICSYIDICFHCRNMVASNDMSSLHSFTLYGDQNWKNLANFFKWLGLKYQMPDW